MITMQDIADSVKVSRGTVSYVLNGKYKKAKISEATKDQILVAAEKLGYRRNAIAQSMKTGKTNVIGFIGGLYSDYCMEIIKGINSCAAGNNYMIKLLPALDNEAIKNVARQCVEQRLAGVICRSLTEEGLSILRNEIEPQQIPMVLVDSSFSHDWSSRVISDDITGARKATEYLLSLGHQKIMHITNDLNRGFSRERHDGYCTAMDAAGMAMHKNICIIDSNLELTDHIQSKITDSLLNYKPTAIFCGSDPIAMKVIIVASMLKLRIPEDLSIVGYAGLDISQITNPPLTTIKQDFEEMGLKAANVLFDEINGCKQKRQVKLPVELIIRKSTLSISNK